MKTFIKRGDRVDGGDTFKWTERGYELEACLTLDEYASLDDFEKGCTFDPDDPDHGVTNKKVREAFDGGVWHYYIVNVKATRCGLVLGHDSLCAIEGNFDYDGKDIDDGMAKLIDNTYFNEVIADCASQAMDEAKAKIFELQASLLNL
jgi:hypothetical protein